MGPYLHKAIIKAIAKIIPPKKLKSFTCSTFFNYIISKNLKNFKLNSPKI